MTLNSKHPPDMVRGFAVAAVWLLPASWAQACGFTGGAGLESLFSLRDPLDILLLAVVFGAVCAFVPWPALKRPAVQD